MSYDAVVVGLGAMGSAALYQLAKSGARVLGVDRYSPPHTLGSTHGDTRITRLAIGEGIHYAPLVRRSHELWKDIESRLGVDLLHQCGGLVMATPDSQGMHDNSQFLQETIATAEKLGIEHRTLSAAEIGEQFPQFELAGSEQGYLEPSAGYLRPERCVEAQLELARRSGASVRFGERLLSYDDEGDRVTARTTSGTVTTRKLVITAGPWVSQLVPELAAEVRVYRQVLYWFDLSDRSHYDAYRTMPVFIWGYGHGRNELIYGFPMVDGPEGGAKVAGEDYTTYTTVDAVSRTVGQDEIDAMYEGQVRDRLPWLSGRCIKACSCLYTVAPDSRFIIDVHPTYRNVIIASPCSGHGFKHSAAIGEALSQLALTGRTDIDISMFGYPSRDVPAELART